VIVAVFPEQHSEAVADGLILAGVTVVGIDELAAESAVIAEADALVVEITEQPMRRLRELTRVMEVIGLPVMAVVAPDNLILLEGALGLADFVVDPVEPVEFRIRLNRITRSDRAGEALRFKDLEINPLHYRATLAGEPMDLTFVEYELLKFLVENPARVWSRQQLLSKVWGYEYYGGARTVDVHIRRLRSKLGGERSSWISTVRSVGYRFG
jgi:DNA-binding response OmpR family regulator